MALLGQQQGEQLLSHCIIDITDNDLGFIIRGCKDQDKKKKKKIKKRPLKRSQTCVSEHIGMQWRLKKPCLSQGLVGDEMWALVLGEVPALSWWYWAVDQKCWHFRRRTEKFILEHTTLNEHIFFLGMNKQIHASNTNLQKGTEGLLPPGIISA